MGRPKSSSATEADLKAKPILDALQQLAREFANKKNGRKKLQEFTGLSKGGLDGLLYSGKGSPLTWINVFLCIFNLNSGEALKALSDFESILNSKLKADPSDKLWHSISKNWSEETKQYWLSVIEFAHKHSPNKK